MAERSSKGKDFSGLRRYEKDVRDLYSDVEDAFSNKADQIVNLERYWRIFNTELTVNQAYNGNSQIYLPLVRDAIEARVTRFVNMLFPETEQHVDVIPYGGEDPLPIMAMLNHYVDRANMRLMTPALLRNGEVEGHYSIYMSWAETSRFVTQKKEVPILIDGIEDPSQTILDIEDVELKDLRPEFEIIPAADLVVFPVTVDDVEHADFVAIRRRYTKGKIRELMRQDVLEPGETKALLREWDAVDATGNYNVDIEKKKIEAAGIKRKDKHVVLYEVWRKFKIDGDRRWCRLFLRGAGLPPLAFRINPNWNDRCSLISMPRTKVSGSFWGKSPVDAVEQLQYAANDAANMAWDSAQYSLLPIVMTNPEKNPNLASMTLSLASVWLTNPADTQFATFPQLWKEALQIVGEAKSQIMQSFGLNPAMMPQGVSAKRPTQAQVSQETAVAIESTANEVTVLERGVFTPVVQRMFEGDQQFRDKEMQVKIYGQLGIAATMIEVPVFAWDDRYEFRWRGVETFRSAQAVQQMIAGLNILRSLPPVLASGARIMLDPIIEKLVEVTYGPRLASRILVNMRDQLAVPPDLENSILATGLEVPVHMLDDDPAHLQAHQQAVQIGGDPTGVFRMHIMAHMAQMQQKQGPQGQQGQPGAGGAPGQPGGPRPGAQPGVPRGGQQPPGAIHQDQLQDPGRMPQRGTIQ